MVLVRHLMALCVNHNVYIKQNTVYISGQNNALSEHISRQQMPEFLRKCSHYKPVVLSFQRTCQDFAPIA